MERNGYGNGMETELQNMDRNGGETEENRGMEGGENTECKGMKTEDYRVYLSPPLTWCQTLFLVPGNLFLNIVCLFFHCLILDSLFFLPFVIYVVFATLTGRRWAVFPFFVTWRCLIYPLLKGELYLFVLQGMNDTLNDPCRRRRT